jgi:hypothetical protein
MSAFLESWSAIGQSNHCPCAPSCSALHRPPVCTHRIGRGKVACAAAGRHVRWPRVSLPPHAIRPSIRPCGPSIEVNSGDARHQRRHQITDNFAFPAALPRANAALRPLLQRCRARAGPKPRRRFPRSPARNLSRQRGKRAGRRAALLEPCKARAHAAERTADAHCGGRLELFYLQNRFVDLQSQLSNTDEALMCPTLSVGRLGAFTEISRRVAGSCRPTT